MEWDEASCGQLVWLYNEAMVHFAGQTERFFASLARPDRETPAARAPRRAVSFASPRLISAAVRRIWRSLNISLMTALAVM
ncbi:SrfB [Cronobacter malonaticus 507]|nr:SrfB [Cronobacter malonaticus 507]